MADKNVQLTQRNSANTGWDNINPKTKAANVTAADGTTLEAFKTSTTTALNTISTKQDAITFSATAPSSPKTNQVWIDTANGLFKYYSGSAWVTLGAVYK